MLGAGGGTSSYEEIETTDVILLWGSNARETHPIFFHHLLKGLRNGAKMYSIDPRRTSSAEFADVWLGIDVGSDIALANAVGREIITAGLTNNAFIEHSTSGFDEYAAAVDSYTLDRAAEITGVPAALIKQMAHDYASADTAQLCWTLGITEHHNATDNVFALINLALLTGHVGRYGSGLVPIRGQNNVQGGADVGGLPNKLPGYQNIEDPEHLAKFNAAWNTNMPAENGWHISRMFDAMEDGDLKALYVLGENPAQSEADSGRAVRCLESLDFMVAQDMFLTKTAELADVVLPAAAGWAETEGTVTSSERRTQRVRRAVEPPGEAKDDIEILALVAQHMGHDWPVRSAYEVWEEVRSVSPMHAGMSYERLEKEGGLQWPCPSEDHPGTQFLHGWLWEDPMPRGPAPFTPTEYVPPLDELTDEYPVRLTTGRRLESYNTGVQSGRYKSPKRLGGVIELAPEDGVNYGVAEGDRVMVVSRRGSIEAPVRFARNLRPGLAFMALHFPDETNINLLTNEFWDPKAGTAEFKATAVRIQKV